MQVLINPHNNHTALIVSQLPDFLNFCKGYRLLVGQGIFDIRKKGSEACLLVLFVRIDGYQIIPLVIGFCFPHKSGSSIITIDGPKDGSLCLADHSAAIGQELEEIRVCVEKVVINVEYVIIDLIDYLIYIAIKIIGRYDQNCSLYRMEQRSVQEDITIVHLYVISSILSRL